MTKTKKHQIGIEIRQYDMFYPGQPLMTPKGQPDTNKKKNVSCCVACLLDWSWRRQRGENEGEGLGKFMNKLRKN